MYTIGHSTRNIDEFINILHKWNVDVLVDIRSYPSSKFAPQYNKEALRESLEPSIHYLHIEKLGGRRSTNKNSINQGWHNKSFRGYADYMQTESFREGMKELLSVDGTVAIMCAEAVPWRCHRSMVSDALLIRGIEVLDIFSDSKLGREEVTKFAEVNGEEITYPGSQLSLLTNGGAVVNGLTAPGQKI